MKIREFAGCVLFDEQNKILLQYRGQNYRHLQNSWCFFGGKMEKAETRENCVKREILEELNYKLNNFQYITSGKYNSIFDGKNEKHLVHIFIQKIQNEDIPKLELLEGDDWGWFTIDEAVKLEMPNANKEILLKIKNLIEHKH